MCLHWPVKVRYWPWRVALGRGEPRCGTITNYLSCAKRPSNWTSVSNSNVWDRLASALAPISAALPLSYSTFPHRARIAQGQKPM